MKLLLDHNLSPRLVRLLADVYPDCAHVHDLGLDRATDTEIWNFAVAHGFAIVSKDADFYQRSLLLRSPPKVIWLTIGNCTVTESADVLRSRFILVHRFLTASEADSLLLS